MESRRGGTVAHAGWFNWMSPPLLRPADRMDPFPFLIRVARTKPITAMEARWSSRDAETKCRVAFAGRPRLAARLAWTHLRRGDRSGGAMRGGVNDRAGCPCTNSAAFACDKRVIRFRGSARPVKPA
jgi:hypothetical protein